MALVACRAPSPVAGSIVGHQFIGLLQRRDPLQRHRTASPDSGPWRRRLIERYDGGLAAVGTGGEHHPVRFDPHQLDRKSTRLNSSHVSISYAVFCLKKKKIN